MYLPAMPTVTHANGTVVSTDSCNVVSSVRVLHNVATVTAAADQQLFAGDSVAEPEAQLQREAPSGGAAPREHNATTELKLHNGIPPVVSKSKHELRQMLAIGLITRKECLAKLQQVVRMSEDEAHEWIRSVHEQRTPDCRPRIDAAASDDR